ncbi:histone acetyltransferase, ELP3 family [Methanothermus fervidus DSM 2088]|uniref:tRNA carboxymethyluridine synthase n=1 Tax=Methanothermus fervidus (strain ATCC 43054 / DSM 2088 / JCM 10308 / V24 S) TaxID=523846 RepID=E3GYV6_METFV|nr:histone acetyltransferase, ELP3 family [Methanothermus fervidus DSM 2088]
MMIKKACRYIIKQVKEGKVKNKDELEIVKRKACKKFGIKKFVSNSEILKYATQEEKEIIAPIIRKKPVRTISGVAVVAVMCHPTPCPHGKCLYCPQSTKAPPSYTGEEPAALRARRHKYDPYRQVKDRLDQLKSIGHPIDKVELIIMGGTFPAHDLCYQEWFVSRCLQAMNEFGSKKEKKEFQYLEDIQKINEKSKVRCVGMTVETRPDYSKEEDVDRMLSFGVTRVELGVQTIYNYIYHRVKRGHDIKDVIEANRILRDSGLKVGMHIMPGLFADEEKDLRIFKRLFSDPSFRPDMLKIYPCLVTKESELYELWKRGEYRPYNTEEAVELIVKIKKLLPKWVRTMRIQRDIPSPLIVDGVKKSNLGELVYRKLKEEGVRCKCIRCREIGHRMKEGVMPEEDNIKIFKEEYKAADGKEIFISHEDKENDVLVGFLRLRIPSKKAHRKEIDENTAIVRELHVYGPMVPIGKKSKMIGQHRGYGEELLKFAENIALKRGKNKIVITSGIGVRDYYRNFGYKREGPYMAKILDQ